MSNKRRGVLRTCLALFLFLAFLLLTSSLILLELGSRWYTSSGPDLEAPEILVCHTDYYPVNPEKVALLEDLVEKDQAGLKITSVELENAALIASEEDMIGLNGIVCNEMIIVSSRLKGAALSYVIRHELEHIYQMAGLRPDCEDWELCATWIAAAEYPGGFIATIISSLVEAYRLSDSIWEFLFSSWSIFKLYLIPG
jgi:hypothetical protein